MKKIFIFAMVFCLLVGCFPTAMADSAFSSSLDMTKWQYNASDDVYWQVGIQYCSEPADLPELPNGEKPADAPELPNGEKPVMIDFDEMVTRGVISQETCDKIKVYMEEHKPAGMPEMNGQTPDGEKPEGLHEMNGELPADGQTPPELPDGEKPEGMLGTNGQAPEAPAMGGLLKELLDAEVITQAEYNALADALTADDT